MLPPSVDEWLPEDHLARFVVEITDQLDISALEGAYSGSGSDAYHPAKQITADNGYYSEANTEEGAARGLTPYLATGRRKHNPRWDQRRGDPDPPPESGSWSNVPTI